MKISAAGLDLIKRSEGLRLQPYADEAGNPTIGYGHRIVPPSTYEHGITEATADQILADDASAAAAAVERLVQVPLTQGQFDALVDFVFNLGAGRLAQSTLLELLNVGDYAGAGSQLLPWDHVGGRVVDGLAARRRAEYEMWEGR